MCNKLSIWRLRIQFHLHTYRCVLCGCKHCTDGVEQIQKQKQSSNDDELIFSEIVTIRLGCEIKRVPNSAFSNKHIMQLKMKTKNVFLLHFSPLAIF